MPCEESFTPFSALILTGLLKTLAATAAAHGPEVGTAAEAGDVVVSPSKLALRSEMAGELGTLP